MTWKRSRVAIAAVVIAGIAVVAWRTGLATRVDPNALWRVVHNLCVPDEVSNHNPAPCVAVDLVQGYAVLRDERGTTQVLVIPTAKVTGIEDPAVIRAGAPNYWEDAWVARAYVEKLARRPIPRDDVGMAINSLYGRSQNQLHIHVDCIAPEVKQALAGALDRIGPVWTERIHLHYRDYHALWIPDAALATSNPFKRAADGDPAAGADMSRETLALLPATSRTRGPGFVLLADRAGFGNEGHAEILLDHHCRVLKAAS